MFGLSQAERRVQNTDFYVAAGETLDEVEERKLYVEVRLEFDELQEDEPENDESEDDDSDEVEDDPAVPQVFRHMVLDNSGQLFCRVRLEATYTRGSLAEGDIEEKMFWLMSEDENPADEHKLHLKAYQRDQIQVIYLPAARNPERELKNVSGTILNRILRAAKWSGEPETIASTMSEALEKAFHKEGSVAEINDGLEARWKALYTGPELKNLRLKFSVSRLDELLQRVRLVFSAEVGQAEHDTQRLSEGWRSLLYFALVSGMFDIEQAAIKADAKGSESNFASERLTAPALTVFAVEEPENHLSPHYLGRIMRVLRTSVEEHYVQVLLTSHSTSIMSRVEPIEVRHFRLDDDGTAIVSCIKLPKPSHEAFKFINDAVKAYPELYFARLVILGEGDTEEIVLPRLARATSLDLDPALISVVPLGGRHVNHMWRLLDSLSIPYVTLLDLDFGRAGGGWGRIKYVIRQLVKNGTSKKELPEVQEGEKTHVLTEQELEEMHKWELDLKTIHSWTKRLEEHGVFFSKPLDLDFLMLKSYESSYKENALSVPKIPKKESDRPGYFEKVVKAVYGDEAEIRIDEESDLDLLAWYRTLFLGVGKPAVHLSTLSELGDDELAKSIPTVIKRLLKNVQEQLDADEN